MFQHLYHIVARAAVPAVIAGFFFCGAVSVHAYQTEFIPGAEQVYGDFVVGPTKTFLDVSPGESRVIELMVTNRMGDERVFRLQVEDMKGSTDPSQSVVLLGNDRGPYSLRDYLKFPEETFVLRQGERARIPVTVAVPQDAEPGGLYGSVLVTTHSKPVDGEDVQSGAKPGTVIESRIGALFFVTVPGDVAVEGRMTAFTTIPEGKNFFDYGPVGFQILFENTGSLNLNPYGVVSVKNMLGQEVGSIDVEPWFALPASVRLREVAWTRGYLFGRYTAEARIHRGYGEEVDVAEVVFYVVPWKMVAVGFVGLFITFFILRIIVRFIRSFEIRRK